MQFTLMRNQVLIDVEGPLLDIYACQMDGLLWNKRVHERSEHQTKSITKMRTVQFNVLRAVAVVCRDIYRPVSRERL